MPKDSFDFQQIHVSYRPKITRYLARLAGESQAEDLCQEVFTKIEQGLKNFRGECGISTWVYRIATNTFNDWVRSRYYKQEQKEALLPAEEIDALKEEPPLANEPPPSIEQQVIKHEMINCIRGYIDQLPEDYRIALLLSEEEGFKDREIADILHLSLENVKVRLHRARAKLKESLQGNCEFYLDERSEIACDRKQNATDLTNQSLTPQNFSSLCIHFSPDFVYRDRREVRSMITAEIVEYWWLLPLLLMLVCCFVCGRFCCRHRRSNDKPG